MDVPATFRPQGTPKSAYIHIPFCRHRCGYCNFALVADRDYLIDRFLSALEIELSWLDQSFQLDTLFLGGGTPSHLAPSQIGRLFEILDKRFEFQSAEVTTEANPSDLNRDRIQLFTERGVNRFSLGVQSFRSEKLQFLQRDHNADMVRSVVGDIYRYTDNLSLDLIFASQDETLEDWLDDLRAACELAPKHLSTYELTIEKGTEFWRKESSGDLVQAGEDHRAELYLATQDYLTAQGIQQYEISSFASKGYRCRHNLVYWSGQPYFAFGAGASRYIDGIRETNHASVSTYIKRIESGGSPVSSSEMLEPDARARELIVVGLRQFDGVRVLDFEALIGPDFRQIIAETPIVALFERGLLEFRRDRIALTQRGLMLYDSVAEVILNSPIE